MVLGLTIVSASVEVIRRLKFGFYRNVIVADRREFCKVCFVF